MFRYSNNANHSLASKLVPVPTVLSAVLAMASPAVMAVDYYVDRGAGWPANTPDCGLTAEDPCGTIAYTVGPRADSGDDIYLIGTTTFQPRAIQLYEDLAFHGLGASQTVLDAGGVGQHFSINSGATVSFEGMTLRNGLANNTGGGAIDVADGNLDVNGVTFTDNRADEGGAVRIQFGTMSSKHSRYSNNRAEVNSGGAILCWSYVDPGCTDLEVLDSVFVGNYADDDGGAIATYAETNIRRSDFFENSAGIDGGALNVGIYGSGQLNLRRSQFSDNSARYGGAVAFRDGAGDFRRNSFVDNVAVVGGAIYGYWVGPEPDALTIVNSTFSGNAADTAGAISGSGTVEFSTFVDNSANPGQAQDLNGTFEVNRSLITHIDAGLGEDECVGVFTGENNLVDTTSCGGLGFRDDEHDNTQLNDLRYWGGRTKSYGIDGTSLAVGAAITCDVWYGLNNKDQRGAERPGGGLDCDIGSFERQF